MENVQNAVPVQPQTFVGFTRAVNEYPTEAIRARSHWLCRFLGHKFHLHPTANWFWCERCAREEIY